MKMNMPNKLTILRILLIPVFVFFMLGNTGAAGKWIAGLLFIAASLTDTLDGYLARKNDEITVFGKFMDPLADKLLVCSALICLVQLGRLSAWVVIIIVSREFIISGFRLVAAHVLIQGLPVHGQAALFAADDHVQVGGGQVHRPGELEDNH